MIINGVGSASCSAPLSTVQYEEKREIAVAIKRSFLDIDLNALPPDESPPAALAVEGNGINSADDGGRRRRRWEALLDAAAICLHAYGGEETEFQIRGQRRMLDAVAVAAPPPVLRSKRGRVLALPNRYKDSVVGSAVEEEFPRRGKSSAAISSAANRKYRRL